MGPEIKQTLDDLERQRQAEPRGFLKGGPGVDERMLAVGPEAALFLNSLIHATGAKRVLEVGGSMGYSTIWMAEAAEANGGRVISLEALDHKVAAIRERAEQAGLARTIDIRQGDALQILRELDGPFDFVLIDAWKDDYPAYLDLVFPKLKVGGLILADNITFPAPAGKGIEMYLEKARTNPATQTQLVPLGNGLELTIKLA
ncbi:MAG: O-methyltransferase [Chloroflexota bacterium]